MKNFSLNIMCVAISALALQGCGGGGSESGGASAPAAAAATPTLNPPTAVTPPAVVTPSPGTPVNNDLQIKGTVAIGRALASASVQAICATGQASAVSGANGSYQISVTNGKLPCALTASSADALIKLKSAAVDDGTKSVIANISSLTDLIMTGFADSVFTGPSPSVNAISSATVESAKTRMRDALSTIVDFSNIEPFRDLLAAKTATQAGNSHDLLLDALNSKLAAAQITQAGLIEIINTNSASHLAEIIRVSAQPKSATCTGLSSGTYRVIEPANPTPVYTITFDAQAMTAVTPKGPLTLTADGCNLTASDGSSIVMSTHGIGVLRSAVGSLGTVMPLQNLRLADLTGNWNFVGRARANTTTAYSGSWGEFNVGASGATTGFQICDKTACAKPTTGGLTSFTANLDGSFTSDTNERFYAYRAASGAMALVGIASAGGDTGKILVARQDQPSVLPAVDQIRRGIEVGIGATGTPAGVPGLGEVLITGVNAAAKEYTRRAVGSCSSRTVKLNTPFAQMYTVAQDSAENCLGALSNRAGVTGISHGKLGISPSVLTDGYFTLNVETAPTEKDTVRYNAEQAFVSGNGFGRLQWILPTVSTGGVASSAAGHYFLSSNASKINSPSLGPQTAGFNYVNQANTLSTLAAPEKFDLVTLSNGVLFRSRATGYQVTVKYDGAKVIGERLSDNLNIPAGNTEARQVVGFTSQYFIYGPYKLNGLVKTPPINLAQEFLFTNVIANANLVNASAATKQWEPDASYYRLITENLSDMVLVNDCYAGAAVSGFVNSAAPIACPSVGATAATLESVLTGQTLNGTAPTLANGTISQRQGVRMWVAQTPLSISSPNQFSTFFELGGKVYAGLLVTAGDRSKTSYSATSAIEGQIRYNDAALRSMKSIFAF
jgi:hypothetical protein